MKNIEIMSGIKNIPYDKVNVIKTLQEETIRMAGQKKWDEITAGIEIPDDDTEAEHLSHVTRKMMNRYDDNMDAQMLKHLFCNVKHGLKHSDFMWARKQYLLCQDIDHFCSIMRDENIAAFNHAAKTGDSFHGQPVDEAVVQFVIDHPQLLYGIRENNKIVAIAIPCETQKYLRETDRNRKKYFACHCHYASESILHKEGAVSKTLCNCSLGHTKVFWEAVLDMPLEGRVVSSVLGDGLLCTFEIDLPEEVIPKNPYRDF